MRYKCFSYNLSSWILLFQQHIIMQAASLILNKLQRETSSSRDAFARDTDRQTMPHLNFAFINPVIANAQ